MSVSTTFDSTKNSLVELLKEVRTGETQLPDFQRGWIWDDERVRSLLASVSLSYPIGALMLLEAKNADVKFKSLLVEGVELKEHKEPNQLILDGQQRLTSLFQALMMDQPVATRDARRKSIKRWYYFDISKLRDVNVDREDIITGVPGQKIVKDFRGNVLADYSTLEKEYENHMFPLNQIFNCAEWRMEYQKFWDYDKEKIQLFDLFEQEVAKTFERYQVPVISLGAATPKEAVCQVFEKVNTGGVPLTVFELLTATYAADNYNLREDWKERALRFNSYPILAEIGSDEFLQSTALLATYKRKTHEPERAVSCKRKDILRLPLADYQELAESVTVGFEKAARFLRSQNVFSSHDLPYRTQLVPLAAILAALDEKAENEGVRSKLARWFWCGVFGELYGSAVESRFARDLPEVIQWAANDATEPTTVAEANFAPDRLFSLRTRNSAAYKGLHCLLLRDGAQDLRTGEGIDLQMYYDNRIDIHHIFPKKWCNQHSVDSRRYDSIVNKTPVSAKTNRIIGGKSPSTYLKSIQQDAGVPEERMDEILESHVIESSYVRSDDFENFFASRQQELLKRIERVMGKPVVQEHSEAEIDDNEDLEEVDFSV